MKNIGIVSYAPRPLLVEAERRIIEPLWRRGAQVTAADWRDKRVDWTQFDVVILRAVWDYYHHFTEFTEWLDKVEQLGVRLYNAAPVIRWNMNKRYLADLSAEGISIVPTVFVEKDDWRPLTALLEENAWSRAVIKPIISAAGENTFQVTSESLETADERFAQARQASFDGMMVQPFMKEVTQHGEYSFIFFNDSYSHCVVKKPAPNGFFVQAMYGGTSERVEPSPALVSRASDILRAARRILHQSEPFVYARVDALDIYDNLALMELELFEPYLFLEMDAYAPERLADAIADRW